MAVTAAGKRVIITGIFTDSEDSATDPSSITLRVTDPNGVSTQYTYPKNLRKIDAGVYALTLIVNSAGQWSYTWRVYNRDDGSGTSAGLFVIDPESID